jgi:lysophospholipase L1-like esterase
MRTTRRRPWGRGAWAAVPMLLSLVASVMYAMPAAASVDPDDPGDPSDPGSGCPSLWVCETPPHLYMAALGDSFWSGEGMSKAGVYVPSGGFAHRSGYSPVHVAWMALEMGRRPLVSYTITPAELQLNWGVDRLQFNASSGAQTKDLYLPQMECKGCLTQRAEPQLDSVRPDTNIVFFGLGGNDAGFGSLMSTAVNAYYLRDLTLTEAQWKRKQLAAVKAEVATLIRRMPQVSANVERGISLTRDTAPTADIIVALYPIGVKPTGNASLPQVGGESLDAIYPFAVLVNKAIREAVDRFKADNPGVGVHVFDPNTAGPNGTSVVAGHEGGQPDSYFNGVKVNKSLLADLSLFKAFQESFHPNELGGVAIGKALATWMAAEFPSIFPNGPNFTDLHLNPQASVDYDPVPDGQIEQMATNDPDILCTEAELTSTCLSIVPGGDIVTPLDNWMFPIPLVPLDGAAVPGGSDTGGSPGSIDYSNWIIGDYTNTPTINIPYQYACWLSKGGMKTTTTVSVTINGGLQTLPVTWEQPLIVPSNPCYSYDGDYGWIDDWEAEWMAEWGSGPPL